MKNYALFTHPGKKLLGVLMLFGVLLTAMLDANANCTRFEQDRAEHYAQIAAQRIVSQYGGGNNISAFLESCHFNTYTNQYQTRINVSWNGTVFGSNHYRIRGDLSMNENGGNSRFEQTWNNSSVDNLRFLQGLAIGVVALGVLAATQ